MSFRPDENEIVKALEVVRAAELYLNDFGQKNDLPISTHIRRSGGGRIFITMYSSPTIHGDSGRWFLNHDGSKRNSSTAHAGSIDRAEGIILEAAINHSERYKKGS